MPSARLEAEPPLLKPRGCDEGIGCVPLPRYPGAFLTVTGVPPRVAAFTTALAIFPPDTAGFTGRGGRLTCGDVPFRSDGGTNPVSSARIGPGRTIGGFATGAALFTGFGAGRTGGFDIITPSFRESYRVERNHLHA